MSERILLVGTSYRLAPVELRERIALPPEELASLARVVAGGGGGGEAVALGTCGRAEIYLAGRNVDPRRVIVSLARAAELPEAELERALYVAADGEAARHLCRVAAGLDSPVIGEPQILRQVKRAIEIGAGGPLLGRLFAIATHAGRRARSETGLGKRPASLAEAAAALALERRGASSGTRVLIVGAGAIGGLVADAFRGRAGVEVAVASRTPAHARRLAARCGGVAVSFAALGRELVHADVVVSCTRSPRLVVTAEQVQTALSKRNGSPLLFVDLAVPRNVEPAIGALAGCRLYNVDGIGAVAGGGTLHASGDIERAEAIATEEAERFDAWRRARQVAPAIVSFRRHAEEIRATELARARNTLGRLSPAERQAVETVTAQIVNKLLHLPTVRVKEAADGLHYATVLRDLFALEEAG